MSKIKEFDDILIVGLGLIGGSIAKKIKEIDYSAKVYGFEKNQEILKEAYKKGLVTNDKEIDLKNSKNLLGYILRSSFVLQTGFEFCKKTLTFTKYNIY